MTTWVNDANGNRCSVEYFGSMAAAQAGLDSLKNCTNCTNCSGCSDCSGCSGCSGCSHCLDCLDCSGCSRCSRCSGCSHVALLCEKKGLKGDPSAKAPTGQPPIPIIENIHQRVFQATQAPDALNMGDWHTCGTTHCRAGWVVHLAGEAGYALERFHNTALAAQLIYRESGAPINPCRFYDSNEDARLDIARCASMAATEAK